MKVDIWSDVVCPWCYIGKRRFEAAVGRFAHRDEVEIVWRSFELDPTAPARTEVDGADRLAAKFGLTRQQAVASQTRLAHTAAAEGLNFRFDLAQSGNTFNAHRLLHLARQLGVQPELKERLMRGYFSEAEPIGDAETLVRMAADVGIDSADAREALGGGAYADDVREDEREATELGIRGVPFFVIDRRYGVSGAQSADVLLQAMQQAWADSHPRPELIAVGAASSDAACTGETCAM